MNQSDLKKNIYKEGAKRGKKTRVNKRPVVLVSKLDSWFVEKLVRDFSANHKP